jgi:hypothetical protein
MQLLTFINSTYYLHKMKKIITLSMALLLTYAAKAQLYNNGAILSISTGGILQVNSAFTNKSGSNWVNNGSFNLTGNLTNEATMSAANTGTLILEGTTAQTLSGTTTYLAQNVTFNNAAGVTLSKSLQADGEVKFQNGIVTASSSSEPLAFTSNGTVSATNAPSNTSHVHGYVLKEGTGAFDFPVGDGTRYQKIGTNLTANSTGIVVKYNGTDAGTGTFATTGASATPLASYNTKEHWDISPLSTATGTVTIFWDDYKTASLADMSLLKVAHKSGSTWLNESGNATGNASAGSVTSSSLSAWSPFTLGSISVALPITWLSFTGKAMDKTNVLEWETAMETDNQGFDIERSTEGHTFEKIGFVAGKGTTNRAQTYTFEDNTPLSRSYYRLRQRDLDGKETFSKVLSITQQGKGLKVYPTLVTNGILTLDTEGEQLRDYSVTNLLGQTVLVGKTTQQLDVSHLAQGTYVLKVGTEVAKFVKP